MRKLRKCQVLCSLAVGLLLATSTCVYGFSYQGKLTDANGNPIGGSHSVQFSLFTDQAIGAPDTQIGATLTKTVVPTAEGLFITELDFPASSFNGQPRFLQVTVNGQTLPLRQPLASVPYSDFSFGPWTTNSGGLSYGSNVAIGTTSSPTQRLEVVGGDIKISSSGRGIIFPDGSKQTTASVQGPAGPQGPPGSQGPAGPAGPAAPGYVAPPVSGIPGNWTFVSIINGQVDNVELAEPFTYTISIVESSQGGVIVKSPGVPSTSSLVIRRVAQPNSNWKQFFETTHTGQRRENIVLSLRDGGGQSVVNYNFNTTFVSAYSVIVEENTLFEYITIEVPAMDRIYGTSPIIPDQMATVQVQLGSLAPVPVISSTMNKTFVNVSSSIHLGNIVKTPQLPKRYENGIIQVPVVYNTPFFAWFKAAFTGGPSRFATVVTTHTAYTEFGPQQLLQVQASNAWAHSFTLMPDENGLPVEAYGVATSTVDLVY